MLDKDGLYLYCGDDGKVLCLISGNQHSFIWMRNFVTAEAAIDILGDGILSSDLAVTVLTKLLAGISYYTKDLSKPKEGFQSLHMKRYELII